MSPPVVRRWENPVAHMRDCRAVFDRTERDVRAFAALAPEIEAVIDGPLAGTVVGVKDVIDVAGLPTSAGAWLGEILASRDAAVVARLRSLGCHIAGKTTCTPFAYGFSCPTRHPHDHARLPGPSSAGSAAAVAAGMVDLAIGTDTGGSLRMPAALCGVSALMPRAGRLPDDGVLPLAPGYDRVGFIAPEPEDLLAAWEAFHDSPSATAVPTRVGVVARLTHGHLAPTVAAAWSRAVTLLVEAGFDTCVVDELPPLEQWARPRSLPLVAEALRTHRRLGLYPAERDRYDPEVRAYLDFAAQLPEDIVAAAVVERDLLTARLEEVVDNVGVLVWPTVGRTAPRAVDSVGPDQAPHRNGLLRELTKLTGPVNPSALAAVSVPIPVTTGLPVGIQMAARDEVTALRAAHSFRTSVVNTEART